MQNHVGRFRPLRGGIAVFNPAVNEFGTLGMICAGDDDEPWILSCFHVLCSGDAEGQEIYQPSDELPDDLAAITEAERADADLDCAAARVEPGIEVVAEILGIGAIALPRPPVIGMQVIKSGMATGVTEGTIEDIDGTDVVIRVCPGFPRMYDLSGRSDSGSVWLEKTARAPVALHRAGNDTGREFARATDVNAVLERLRLRPLSSG